MQAKQAEKCAYVAWDAVKKMMCSEVAAQHAIAGTPLDFDILAVTYLTEAFILGKAPPLAKRIDAERYSARDEDTGDHLFDENKANNLRNITYVQGLMAVQTEMPAELRLKYKQLHAKGRTPWEAYSEVKRAWEEIKGGFGLP